jgi:hypothetical protein
MATKTKRKDKPIRIEPIDWHWVEERAHEIYDPIKKELAKKYLDKACAVEAKSGEYFIGEDAMEAIKKGRKKHPDGWYFVFRVGRRAYGKI